MTNVLALGAAELRLTWRNRTVAFMALLFPVAFGLSFAFMSAPPGGAGSVAVVQLLTVLGFTVYATPATSLSTRRQDLFLKRLRSGELSDRAILGGLLAPICAIALAQAVIMIAISAGAGIGLPDNPFLLAVAVGLGTVMCLGAAVATSGFTPTAESAQITTLPFLLVLLGGGIFATAADVDGSWPLLVPGWALARLVEAGWVGGASLTSEILPAIVAQVALAAAVWIAAASLFRWEPRS